MIHDVYQKQPIEIIPDWYTKNRSNIISTVAILLMIAHHFFGFRSFFLEEVDYISVFSLHNIEIERIIAAFGKICVALFAFNSGYVLWKKSADYSNPVKLFNRGFKFLISYWIILAGFWLYALLSEQSIPTGKYLWLNLIGLETGPNAPYINIPFSWYVAYYITFLILAPFLLKAFSRNYICDIISFLCCLSIANISFNYTFLNPLTISATGILFAKYHIFYKVEKLFKNHYNLPVLILILVILIPLRQGAIYLNNPIIKLLGIDIIIAPIFIFVTIKIFEIIFEITKGGGIISLFSQKAMNMWFIHGFYFTGDCPMQNFIYSPRYSFLIYALGIAITLILSMVITPLQIITIKGMSVIFSGMRRNSFLS